MEVAQTYWRECETCFAVVAGRKLACMDPACAGERHVHVQGCPWEGHRWIAACHPYPWHSSVGSTEFHMGSSHPDVQHTCSVAVADNHAGEDSRKACLGLRIASAVVELRQGQYLDCEFGALGNWGKAPAVGMTGSLGRLAGFDGAEVGRAEASN